MSINLTKMAKEWIKADVERRFETSNNTILYNLLEAMAAEIEGNTRNLDYAAETCQNLLETCQSLSERIDILKDRIERLE